MGLSRDGVTQMASWNLTVLPECCHGIWKFKTFGFAVPVNGTRSLTLPSFMEVHEEHGKEGMICFFKQETEHRNLHWWQDGGMQWWHPESALPQDPPPFLLMQPSSNGLHSANDQTRTSVNQWKLWLLQSWYVCITCSASTLVWFQRKATTPLFNLAFDGEASDRRLLLDFICHHFIWIDAL